MVNQPKWARGSNQYVKRPGVSRPRRPESEASLEPLRPSRPGQEQRRYEDTGLTWGSFEVDAIKPSSIERARHRFRAHLPELIWNTAALEGNNFTLPEIRTLLEGVTVGGKRMDDEQQIIALSEAYNRLDEMVGSGQFSLKKEVSDELHELVARHEALDAGRFRGEGQATGGGTVRLANGGVVEGTPHGEGGILLREHFDSLIEYLAGVDDHRQRALVYFASATRRQFYFDGNKRTARLMMTGELMSSGYDIISVPYSRRLEFNEALDKLFADDDATVLLNFLSTCTLM